MGLRAMRGIGLGAGQAWGLLALGCLLLWGWEVDAQELKVLLAAQSQLAAVQTTLEEQPGQSWTLETIPLGEITLAELRAHDVVVVWTDRQLTDADSARVGDVLASFVDEGGGVVEMVFAQSSPNTDIQGRWRRGYSSVGSIDRASVGGAGELGEVYAPSHPIMQGVDEFATTRNRTGGAALAAGAVRLADYDDGQILVAAREDKPGRVAWLGFYPGDAARLSGDWEQLMTQAIVWAGQDVDINLGGPYVAEEGTGSVTITAMEAGTPLRSVRWDLDGDGAFDDAEGFVVEVSAVGFDGPGVATVVAQTTDNQGRTGEATVGISVSNVAPSIESAAPQQVDIGGVYEYEVRVVDPAGEKDPITYELTEKPRGAVVSAEGVVTWAPTSEDLEEEFAFRLRVSDGDGGTDTQSWTVSLRVPDADGDGVLDAQDNCPGLGNADQADLDGDLVGDACDVDIDGDGLNQRQETINGSDPRSTDTDGDGISDGDEVAGGTDPAAQDGDGDGISDPEELERGTNPSLADTDEDGLNDLQERDRATDALNPDTDGDGLKDGDEIASGLNPLNPDTDGDGTPDGQEEGVVGSNNGAGNNGGNPITPGPGTGGGSPAEGDSSCQSARGAAGGWGWLGVGLGLWMLGRRRRVG